MPDNAHIFISYARADGRDLAINIEKALQARDKPVWRDERDIDPGTIWPRELTEAIRTCEVVLAILTPGSTASRHCLAEWVKAQEYHKPIIPVLYRECDVPVPFNVQHHLDFQDDAAFNVNLERLWQSLHPQAADTATAVPRLRVPNEALRPGAARATRYTHHDDIAAEWLPEKGLFGRDDLLATIRDTLTAEPRVLLQGFGGAGKTTLAAQIAHDLLQAEGGEVLWLRLGASGAEAVYEALAAPYDAGQAVAAAQSDDDKRRVLRSVLRRDDLRLLVLDDAWNGPALMALRRALPTGLPVLLTSRNSYPFGTPLEVPDLAPAAAVELVRAFAGDLAADETATRALCAYLGHLAFALEVAGRTMRVDGKDAALFLKEVQAKGATNLRVPLGYAEQGRESVAALLETTLAALPDDARAAFRAWGAFWSPTLTAEMLAYFWADTPEVSAEMLAAARALPDIPDDIPDEALIPLIQRLLLQQTDPTPAENALMDLQRYGLAKRNPAERDEHGYPVSVAYFRLHDLAYAHTAAATTDDQQQRAVDACLAYIDRYDEPSRDNFAALRPELDNCLDAAAFAMSVERYSDVEEFAWDLYADSQVLIYLGFYAQSLDLLSQAATAAERAGNRRDQGAHLGNLGSAYSSLGQYARAIEYYEQALAISREIGDRRNQGAQLGNLGNAYRNLGQYARAIEYYEQALAIRREIGDRRGEGNNLGGLGSAYFSLGQYERAIEYYEQALAISREIGDRRNQDNWLGNLGSAYFSLGQYARAIEYYEQALAISREIGDRRGEGADLGGLGNAYSILGQYARAIEYHEQALAISREIGARRGEGNDLNNLGVAYEYLEDYATALTFYEQALVIRKALGVPHLVEQVERNIKDAKRGLNDAAKGTTSTISVWPVKIWVIMRGLWRITSKRWRSTRR